jgi:hypothetical protein
MKEAAKLVLAAFLGIAVSTAPASACLDESFEAVVADAPDARSLTLADGRVLRLAGIEPFTLLLDEAEGVEEALFERPGALTTNATVRVALVSEAPDRHGRLPAFVAIGGVTLQERLAREGLAIAVAGDALPCFERILAAEDEARQARRAFWAETRVLAATPEALQSRIGRFAIFEGTVVSVGTRRAASYIDFGTFWSEDVTIEIAAKDREAFGGEAEIEKIAGARIRARGYLVEKAGPMLSVRSPLQIEVLSAGAAGDSNAP